MAIRSAAGTGVTVSLVIFVITSVFLLILTIVFYSGQQRQLEAKTAAEQTLETYVRKAQQNNDSIKNIESAARQRNQSVVMYMNNQREDVARFVDGDPAATLETMKANFSRYGVGENDVVRDVFGQTYRDMEQSQEQIETLEGQLADRDQQISELEAQKDQLATAHRAELDSVSSQINSYRDAAEDYRAQVQDYRDQVDMSVEELRDDYDDEIEELERQIDSLNQERVVLMQRINDYESRLNADRIKAQNPAMLVDGEIVDIISAEDQVFINRGKDDRVVLGMTFEVYDQASAIRVDPRTGQLPRGKASLQVLRVGPRTSACKITRSMPGRPVVRNDVIANAVYDPTYKFKFLVHGKFDVDGDGRPSEAEADFIRSMILDWNGEVISGEEVPGDLDFLVLGEQPPMPPLLPAQATQIQLDDWVRKRQAHERYESLFRQASNAQIPVLNANRFFVLIGYTNR